MTADFQTREFVEFFNHLEYFSCRILPIENAVNVFHGNLDEIWR